MVETHSKISVLLYLIQTKKLQYSNPIQESKSVHKTNQSYKNFKQTHASTCLKEQMKNDIIVISLLVFFDLF